MVQVHIRIYLYILEKVRRRRSDSDKVIKSDRDRWIQKKIRKRIGEKR